MGAPIKMTSDVLEFVVFCIESIASKLHTDGATVYKALAEQSDILQDYIIPEYDTLHTQGKHYIVDELIEVMHERGIYL